jgi:hypothetical protein
MSVEAFCIPGQSASAFAPKFTTSRDASGQDVIRIEEVPQSEPLGDNITTFQDNSGQEAMKIVD